jgi:hypothetical protein
MAFVYREEKLKKIRPNTALGPGQYLPITDTIIVKSNVGRAPFESSVKKFKPLFGENSSYKTGTPGPGNYYKNDLAEKSRKLENLANIKQSSQEENLLQDKFLSKTGNNFKTKYNVNNQKEVLGFEVKEKRFKNVSNINPGPADYFQNNQNSNKSKIRAKSAIEINSKNQNVNKKYKSKNKQFGISVPSIPYNDNGFEIDDNNLLVKLEDPNSFLMFRGDKKESVGPGSYDLDNPKSWLKSGTSWSKMKEPKAFKQLGNKSVYSNTSKLSTRPQTALELSQNIVATHSTISSSSKSVMSRTSTAKMLKNAREQRKWNMLQMREDFREETQKRRNNSNRIPLLASDYYEQMEKFSNKQIPGPGYYIDIVKESDFYKKSMPYPEFKQFFLSNNERFPESKTNELLGPTTYYKDNIYYKSAFNTGEIDKIIDINKNKETPFSTRAKRFGNNANLQKSNIPNTKTPGPGAYNPKIIKTTQPNKFNNFNNTFNFRQRRIGPSPSELKWQMETPGPGEYINPYTATGTSNTLLINGLYIDIRKGKELLRQKAETKKPLRQVGLNTPGVGSYEPDKVLSIAYNNRKKAKERKENEKLKIAFDSHMKDEKQLNELKSNLGPGIYFRELPSKSPCIRSPFQNGVERLKDEKKGSGIEPGHYDIGNYFDWNKKTYNVSYL